MGIFSQIWKFLLETQDHIGSFRVFISFWKLMLRKCFFTWNCYPIFWSFWWNFLIQVSPLSFSSPGHSPSHLAAGIVSVGSQLPGGCHCRHALSHSSLLPSSPWHWNLVSACPLSFWIHLAFYLYSILCPLTHLAWSPMRSLALAVVIQNSNTDQIYLAPLCRGWGQNCGDVIQILFGWIVLWPADNISVSFSKV